jgi:hypothetical protein
MFDMALPGQDRYRYAGLVMQNDLDEATLRKNVAAQNIFRLTFAY